MMFKKAGLILCCLIVLLIAQFCGDKQDEIESIAVDFVTLLEKGDFESAVKGFDATMKTAMPPEKLEQTWRELLMQTGQFKQQTSTRQQKFQQYDIVFITCEFEEAALDIQMTFDSSKNIAGLFFRPSQQSYEYDPPPYAESDLYTEKEVTVGTGEWSLPGTLAIPKADGPFPAVILVHGSGPHDRDETVLPNKPFRDLAWGLATKGVAVLRYEKRTKHHSAKFVNIVDKITVEEETIADALAAASLLRNTPEIDADRIFILGHSLGGMLIPRIAPRDKKIAGFIIMAGATRPLEDIIYEQFTYIYNLDNQLTDEEQKHLKELQHQVQLAKSPELDENTPSTELPLGMHAIYLLDLRDYDPAKEAAKLTRPVLILHGERDYQITMEDFKGWQESLSSHENIRFKLYPSLNHLFMSGEGKSKPSEYEEPGHVDISVINTISDWIHEVSSKQD